ncbi:50S ribosomal protein L28 [Rickettsiales endosymbiont of Paramecium tredecaurelia]|uniref:50S ribosomal protein L28 n=1 Tax=Candidatus Sarmatiella mevalonica TaxID=2770581 RepID=UPI0019215EDA|nr:50S ribosomal protein L28 [Candidatus Sarmatiella mevalonica]MBL3285110.1 50S ribosomal protein L28 [Candidatus Sarmatiella mevalonica]
MTESSKERRSSRNCCELTGVGVMYGNNVSHSQRKTRRSFKPNLRFVSFFSSIMGLTYRLRVTANCIRSVSKNGGFDSFILKASNANLSQNAYRIKKLIESKIRQEGGMSLNMK